MFLIFALNSISMRWYYSVALFDIINIQCNSEEKINTSRTNYTATNQKVL